MPPDLIFPLTPTPPVITNVPVDVLLEAMPSSISIPAVALLPLPVDRIVSVPAVVVDPCTTGLVVDVLTVKVSLTWAVVASNGPP